MRQNDSRPWGIKTVPDVLFFDLHYILYKYSPVSPVIWLPYEADPILRRFVESLTLHNVIVACFVNSSDYPGSESAIWEYIEALFPDGTGEFEDSFESHSTFQFLVDVITEEVDTLLRERMAAYGLQSTYSDFLFEAWISPTTAAFAHKDFDNSKSMR